MKKTNIKIFKKSGIYSRKALKRQDRLNPFARFATKDRHFNPNGRTLDNIVAHRYFRIPKFRFKSKKSKYLAVVKTNIWDDIFVPYSKKKLKRYKKPIERLFRFKHLLFFVKKLFSMFIKRGLKIKTINYFEKIKYFIKKRLKIKRIRYYFYFYFMQIVNNILPILNNTNILFKGENKKMPYFTNKKHYLRSCASLSCSWIKESVSKRKEKTLFLKLISELESIRSGNSNSINLKKQYYKDFYDNKYFIKFLKKRNWI